MYQIIGFITLDVLVWLLARCYVSHRMRFKTYKYYEASWQKVLLLSIVFILQSALSLKGYRDVQQLIYFGVVSGFYLFIALVDLSIRIIGNDVLLLFLIIIFSMRLFTLSFESHFVYVCFAIVLGFGIVGIKSLLKLLLGVTVVMGMGDVKLLVLTSYLLGVRPLVADLILMTLLLGFHVLWRILQGKFRGSEMIPLAPFISLATLTIFPI